MPVPMYPSLAAAAVLPMHSCPAYLWTRAISTNSPSSDSYSYSVMAKPGLVELKSGEEDELEGGK